MRLPLSIFLYVFYSISVAATVDLMVSRIGSFAKSLLLMNHFGPMLDTIISTVAALGKLKNRKSKSYSWAGDKFVEPPHLECKKVMRIWFFELIIKFLFYLKKKNRLSINVCHHSYHTFFYILEARNIKLGVCRNED